MDTGQSSYLHLPYCGEDNDGFDERKRRINRAAELLSADFADHDASSPTVDVHFHFLLLDFSPWLLFLYVGISFLMAH